MKGAVLLDIKNVCIRKTTIIKVVCFYYKKLKTDFLRKTATKHI